MVDGKHCENCSAKEKVIKGLREVNQKQLRRLNETYLLKQRVADLERDGPPPGSIELPITPDGVTIIISGQHNTGRSTIAAILANFLRENGYHDIRIQDTEPTKQKEDFEHRWKSNRQRPIRIFVNTEEG